MPGLRDGDVVSVLSLVQIPCGEPLRANGRSRFVCVHPAGHLGGHYFVGADVADGRHDDNPEDH